METYTGPDGTLYVWTGTGYHPIPKIAAIDVGDLATWRPEGVSDGAWENSPKFTGYGITGGDYGLPTGYNSWHQEGGDANAFNYLLKSGDKEGTKVTFTKNGDYYVPSSAGTFGWDSNQGKQNLQLAAVLGSALGGMYGFGGEGAAAGAGGEAGGLLGDMSYEAIFGGALPEGTLSGMPFEIGGAGAAAGAAGAGAEFLSQAGSLLSNPNVLKGIGLLGGTLLGGSSQEPGGSPGDPYANVQPVPTPQMYGGNPAIPQFQTQGNTETERRMVQQYLPSLFPSGGLLAKTQPYRRSLLGGF